MKYYHCLISIWSFLKALPILKKSVKYTQISNLVAGYVLPNYPLLINVNIYFTNMTKYESKDCIGKKFVSLQDIKYKKDLFSLKIIFTSTSLTIQSPIIDFKIFIIDELKYIWGAQFFVSIQINYDMLQIEHIFWHIFNNIERFCWIIFTKYREKMNIFSITYHAKLIYILYFGLASF